MIELNFAYRRPHYTESDHRILKIILGILKVVVWGAQVSLAPGLIVVAPHPFKQRPRRDCHNQARLDEVGHWPTPAGGSDRLCVVCNKKHRNYLASHTEMARKDVPYKRTKTTMACVKCDVPLCCNARSTCYRDFRTKVAYWQ